MIKRIITLFFLFYTASSFAGFFSFLWGKPVHSGVFYEPYGIHTRHGPIVSFQLVGANYHSFFALTFINSFGDRTWAAGVTRYLFQYKRFSIGYAAGFLYGYNGQLSTVNGIPFKNTFLFKGDINPGIACVADLALFKRVSWTFVLAPLVVTTGLRITLGAL